METLDKLLVIWGLVLGVFILALILFFFWASAAHYPQEKYAEIVRDDAVFTPTKEQPVFSVMTYNIGYLSGLTNNEATRPPRELFEENLKRVLGTLKPLNIDIMGLQEIDLPSHRSYEVHQVEALSKGLGMAYGAIAINWDKNYLPFPYWPPSVHFRRILSSQTILSQSPIRHHERLVLSPVENRPFFYKAFYLDRLAQIAEIEINGQPIIVINVHLEAFEIPTRRRQTKAVLDILAQYETDYPVLLMGDFNSDPHLTPDAPDSTIQLLLNHPKIRSVVPEKAMNEPEMKTFPSNEPTVKLDYIFYTPDSLELVNSKVLQNIGQASDHLPVLAKFRLVN
ncbi:endonuclease/exonuclease/phosphatase family protein [Spirulina subsalsa FACHB-351]|uniref:Endonuclease/exonuclease/phosphatase family protein n=2 Tax=Spirulina subsalsa TaxID=54311 RepID=A0ABT3L3I4_9CYAN|nr:endonuclease/exonuclease/phosphatase family protein [Spirulina subsalsa FACHB-351]